MARTAVGGTKGATYTVYFCGEFGTIPEQARTFRARNSILCRDSKPSATGRLPQAVFEQEQRGFGALNDRIGAVFTWKNSEAAQISSRIGISFLSVSKACKFKDDEIPSWDLNDTVSAAVKEWNTDVFSKIQVPTDDTANTTNLILLYSSLYFMHLMPSDRTGENPLWESDAPYWDDFYTLWDIFRCTVSLYHLIQPERYEGMIRALIDIWRWEGFMPDGRSGNYNGLVQGAAMLTMSLLMPTPRASGRHQLDRRIQSNGEERRGGAVQYIQHG